MASPAEELLAAIRRGEDIGALLGRLESGRKGGLATGTRAAGERIFENFAMVPELAARAVPGVPGPILGRSQNVLPLPTGREALATIDALPALMPGGQSFQNARSEALVQRDLGVEDNPSAAGLGGALGDAVTLLSGRSAMRNTGVNKLGSRPAAAVSEGIRAAAAGQPGLKRAVARALNSKPIRRLAASTGRSLEAGLEGAALGVLADRDPLEVAAWSAGSQSVNNLLLGISQGLIKKNFSETMWRLTGAAMAFGSIAQLLKTSTPGGPDSIIDSVEGGYSKVALTLALGALAGMAGGGRLTGKFAEDLPEVADMITGLPRIAGQSLIRDIVTEAPGSDLTLRTLEIMQKNPGALEKYGDRLLKAFEEGTFTAEILKLNESDKEFAEMMGVSDPRLAGVPQRRRREIRTPDSL